MSFKNANIAKYYFRCSDLSLDTFYLRELAGKDSLSGLYSFDIALKCGDHDITVDDIINKKATLFLYRGDKFYPYSGIVSKSNLLQTTKDFVSYRITLRPSLWKLTLTKQCKVFQKMKIPDIIKEIIDNSDLKNYCKFKIKQDAYIQQDYVVQYNETDFNFITRLMQREGLWYFFEETTIPEDDIVKAKSEEKLIITDDPSNFKLIPSPNTLKFRMHSEMIQQIDKKDTENIYEMELCRDIIPEKVIIKNYNYRNPTIDLSCEKPVPNGDMGVLYEYGGSYKNVSEAETYVKMLSQRFATKQVYVNGKSSCNGLRAGNKVEMEEHMREELNQLYFITEVKHQYKESMDKTDTPTAHYSNSFKAIPSVKESNYRPDSEFVKPRIPDFMTAKIEGSGEEYSTLDETGKYKVRMPFDNSDSEKYQASKYIRMAQEYSGSNYGIHFPTHEKGEIVIAHINGDPDKPVGLRVIPNPDNLTPVKSDNKQQSIIRTAGDNEILLDDTDGSQEMNITTPGDNTMSAGHDQSVSVTEDRSVTVGENETKNIDVDQTISVEGNQKNSVVGNKEETIEGCSKIDITKDSSEEVTGNKTIDVTGEQTEKYSASRSVEVSGDNTENIDGNQSIDITATSTLKVSGNLTIKSEKNVSASGLASVIIDGMDVTIKGEEAVVLEAGAGVSTITVTSGGINIKSPTVTKIGAMIKSEAKTNNNVTGMVVMLN